MPHYDTRRRNPVRATGRRASLPLSLPGAGPAGTATRGKDPRSIPISDRVLIACTRTPDTASFRPGLKIFLKKKNKRRAARKLSVSVYGIPRVVISISAVLHTPRRSRGNFRTGKPTARRLKGGQTPRPRNKQQKLPSDKYAFNFCCSLLRWWLRSGLRIQI